MRFISVTWDISPTLLENGAITAVTNAHYAGVGIAEHIAAANLFVILYSAHCPRELHESLAAAIAALNIGWQLNAHTDRYGLLAHGGARLRLFGIAPHEVVAARAGERDIPLEIFRINEDRKIAGSYAREILADEIAVLTAFFYSAFAEPFDGKIADTITYEGIDARGVLWVWSRKFVRAANNLGWFAECSFGIKRKG